MTMPTRHRYTSARTFCLAAGLIACFATAAQAQPFNGYMALTGDSADYIQIPHNAALNPTTAITLEGWVRYNAIACTSLIGKNYVTAFWVGPCNSFRSYLSGSSSSNDAGAFVPGVWTHFAVTSDGTTKRHYVNGVLSASFPAAAPTANTDPVRIGSDVSWEFAPDADLDEFRLWNVARTQAQIQGTMNGPVSSPMTGLVAVWPLDTDGSDALGNFDGTVVGNPLFVEAVPAMPPPAVLMLMALLAGIAVWSVQRSRTPRMGL
jgi:hypothetical protein